MSARVNDSQLVDEWRALLERHARTSCQLESALKEHDLGVSEFEVLERLVTEGAGARVQQLADSVHLSQSALSRVIARLEADGLVNRAMCENDRRGVAVCVTAAGNDRYAAAKPAHRAVLADALRD